jgi:hypothetical protein
MAMANGEAMYLALVVGAFTTFSAVVFWLMVDDAKRRNRSADAVGAANDSASHNGDLRRAA